MTLLFDAPKVYELPLSRGGDLYVGFVYKPLVTDEDGNPILTEPGGLRQYVEADYPDGASVQLVIETDDDPIEVDAEIEGSMATVHADKAVADTAKKGKLWRAVITYSSGLDVVMCNGTVTRSDGKAV